MAAQILAIDFAKRASWQRLWPKLEQPQIWPTTKIGQPSLLPQAPTPTIKI